MGTAEGSPIRRIADIGDLRRQAFTDMVRGEARKLGGFTKHEAAREAGRVVAENADEGIIPTDTSQS